MAALADVLEILHGTNDAFDSLHAHGSSSRSAWELWWEGPRRVRQTYGGNLIVVNGQHWWFARHNSELISNEDDPELGVGLGPGEEILHSRTLLGDVRLELRDEIEIAGRGAFLLHATPPPDNDASRWWDYPGPFDVAIDTRTGVVLRTQHLSVTNITFDESFPDDLFARPGDE